MSVHYELTFVSLSKIIERLPSLLSFVSKAQSALHNVGGWSYWHLEVARFAQARTSFTIPFDVPLPRAPPAKRSPCSISKFNKRKNRPVSPAQQVGRIRSAVRGDIPEQAASSRYYNCSSTQTGAANLLLLLGGVHLFVTVAWRLQQQKTSTRFVGSKLQSLSLFTSLVACSARRWRAVRVLLAAD